MNMQKNRVFCGILFFTCLFFSCTDKGAALKGALKKGKENVLYAGLESPVHSESTGEILNKRGTVLISRYNPPNGYSRVVEDENSFAHFLQNLKLRPYGSKALYFDGREKEGRNVYDSVVDVSIGKRDLHQCADAIMLLRAEYLYDLKAFDAINFHFVSGFRAEYKKWMEGYRIRISGNSVSYVKEASPSNTYVDFRKFMDVVFAYASTLSLDKELESVHLLDMQIGDVFIKGGSPGHAVIVVDMAVSETGKKVYMLAQSYMPAQQTQILINLHNAMISPWYELEYKDVFTPEWNFTKAQLKRFSQ